MKNSNPLLAAMQSKEPEQEAEPASATVKPARKRDGQKHLGAYFDKRDPIFERVALLRARLDMTNSELIEHALNGLWQRHEVGRAFGE